jgi:hypothetical protein
MRSCITTKGQIMTTNTVTLTQIAKRSRVNPKIARRRLRAQGVRKAKAGWVFPITKQAEIAKIVRG